MKKLAHIAVALTNNTLSRRDMSHVRGGNNNQDGQSDQVQNALTAVLSNVSNIVEDEKRRERPGGGINTN